MLVSLPQWLKYFSQKFGGDLHTPALTMDDPPPLQNAASVIVIDDEDDEGDEILEMQVKSNTTLLQERYKRAVASGNVHSIQSTAVSSSMRSTFQSISSTVTSMRNSSARVERQIVLEDPRRLSPMIKYEATLMVLDKDHEKFVMASGERSNGRIVKIAMHPFAQGGLRNVFRMEEILKEGRSTTLVAKESRHQVMYRERLRFHIETSSCQTRASSYAVAFNRALKKAMDQYHRLQKIGIPRSGVQFLNTAVFRLKDLNQPAGFRYLAVEGRMTGEYKKWNSNNGYVHTSGETSIHYLVAQAFR